MYSSKGSFEKFSSKGRNGKNQEYREKANRDEIRLKRRDKHSKRYAA